MQHPAWLDVKTMWSKEILGFFCNRQLVAAVLALYRQPSRYVSMSLMYVPGGIITKDFLNTGIYISTLQNYARSRTVTSLYYSDFNIIKTWRNKTVHDVIYKSTDTNQNIKCIDDITDCTQERDGSVMENLLKGAHFKPHLIGEFDGYNARYVVVVDISKKEDELYKGFSSRWKRSIKRAQKSGLTVTRVDDSHINTMYSLYKKTSERNNFIPRQPEYFKHLLDIIKSFDDIDYRLYITYFQNQPISTALILNTVNYACYLYGGSDETVCNIRGAHLMHYRIMQDLMADGLKIYDLKGIPNKINGSSADGLIHFKLGSGGDVVKYVGEWQYGVNYLKHKAFSTVLKLRSLLH
jgi:vancomycin resistance protein VanK